MIKLIKDYLSKLLKSRLISIIGFCLIIWFVWWLSSAVHKTKLQAQSISMDTVFVFLSPPKPDTVIKFIDKIVYKEIKPETVIIYQRDTLPPINFITRVEKNKNNLLITTFHPLGILGDSFYGVPMQYPYHKVNNNFSVYARTNSDPPKLIEKRSIPISTLLMGSVFADKNANAVGLIQGNLFYRHIGIGGLLLFHSELFIGAGLSYKL